MTTTHVDFYVFQQAMEEFPWPFICKLTETIYKKNLPVWIYCASSNDAKKLDTLLWTYNDTSFVPHTLQSEINNTPASIVIGHPPLTPSPAIQTAVLLNISETIPSFYQSFSRIVEIVLPDANSKAKSRDTFREYQRQGYSIKTHNV